MEKIKRYSLLTSYVLLMAILFMLFLGDNLVPRRDESFVLKDTIPFTVWAVVFMVHHIFSYLHLRNDYKVLSFQLFCSIIDLSFLFCFLTLYYFRFKEWMLIWVIGLRIGSLLLTNKKR